MTTKDGQPARRIERGHNMGLRTMLEGLLGRIPGPDDEPSTLDAGFRDLPRDEWIARATIEVLKMRGDLAPISQSRRDPADRVTAIADLPVTERSHRLRALVEEQRGLSRRGESFGSGSGR
jgi:hypothetical protein